MHAGDSAAIPGPVSRYGARFRSGQSRNDLILVVVLWDARDTPANAVAAGYEAFLDEIRVAIADNLLDLSTANAKQTAAIEAKIQKRLHDKVEDAIRGELSDLQKVEVELGLLTPDQLIGGAFRRASIQAADSTETFTLPFNDILNDDFDLQVQMTVTAWSRSTVPTAAPATGRARTTRSTPRPPPAPCSPAPRPPSQRPARGWWR
jgi:hypothetical protein